MHLHRSPEWRAQLDGRAKSDLSRVVVKTHREVSDVVEHIRVVKDNATAGSQPHRSKPTPRRFFYGILFDMLATPDSHPYIPCITMF